MKLVVGGVTIADNLKLVVLPRQGDVITIKDSTATETQYVVDNVEFRFEDNGSKQPLETSLIQWDLITIINAT